MIVPPIHHTWHVLELEKVCIKNLENAITGDNDFLKSMENIEKVLIHSLKFGWGSVCDVVLE